MNIIYLLCECTGNEGSLPIKAFKQQGSAQLAMKDYADSKKFKFSNGEYRRGCDYLKIKEIELAD